MSGMDNETVPGWNLALNRCICGANVNYLRLRGLLCRLIEQDEYRCGNSLAL
jgi:hypothetical protein